MRFLVSKVWLVVATGLFIAGCPADDEATVGRPAEDAGSSETATADAAVPPAKDGAAPDASTARATHTGLVSVQDIAIANIPAAGHGLTVNVFFTPIALPDFEEAKGELTGCRAWSYDVATKPAPPEQDHGELRIAGTKSGPLACNFVPERGYVCPTAKGNAQVAVETVSAQTAIVSVPGAAFTSADIGRYLQLSGATSPGNSGQFAIVAVPSATQVVVSNARAVAESFAAAYAVNAGAGPTPNDLYSPFADGAKITLGLVPGGHGALEIPDTTLVPGEAFALEGTSAARIMAIPITGEAVTLTCATCGKADGTIVRMTATDADLTNASPVAMPPPRKKLVEIQCLLLGAGAESVTVPAAAMELVRAANAISPITRIRTAFMRDGVAIATNKAPKPPNTTYLVSGHGLLGFTKP